MLMLDMIEILFDHTELRHPVHSLTQLIRQNSWLESFVVNNNAAPKQRFIRTKPSYQFNRSALSTSRFQRRSRNTRYCTTQCNRDNLRVSPELFVDSQMAHIVLITAEYLVGPFADLDDYCSGIARQLRNVIKRNTNWIRNWFVLVKDQVRQKLLHLVLRDDHFMMICSELLRDSPRRVQFIQILSIAETNRERFHRPRHLFRHQSHIGRRVNASRKKNSKGNVRHHSFANRVAKQPKYFFLVFSIAALNLF